MIGRLVHKADFARLLAVRSRTRRAHFAVHHVAGAPSAPAKPRSGASSDKLSTEDAPIVPRPVDDFSAGHWVGCVVPKRHARRSVTRTLLKRQIRVALERHAAQLPAGLWLIRLHAPLPKAQFVSASSEQLKSMARTELDTLLRRAA